MRDPRLEMPVSVESFETRFARSRVLPMLYPLGPNWEISIPANGSVLATVQLEDSGPSRVVAVRVGVANSSSLLVDPRGVEFSVTASDGRVLVERVPVSLINGNQGGELLARVPYLLGRGTALYVNFWNLESTERRVVGIIRAHLFDRGAL